MRYIVTLAFAALIMSCGNAQQNSNSKTSTNASATTIENVKASEAQKMIAENSDLQIIDVRTDGECAQGMIDGAVQMNISSSDFDQKIAELDPNGKYLVYCAAGGRSAKAQKMMAKKGFTTVYNLSGGYSNWPAK